MHNKEYRIFKKVLLHIALLIVVLISIFPFIWMLTGATNKSVDVTSGALHFGKSLGENWANLQSSANVFLVFLNSMKIIMQRQVPPPFPSLLMRSFSEEA